MLIFLLFHRYCLSSSLLIFDLPPSSLLLLTLLIHILHFHQSPTAKSVLTNTSKCHPFSHFISLTSISAFRALQKMHPPFLLWRCTVTTDPASSSPLISTLLSIYPTHTAGDFPAIGFLSSAPAGKRRAFVRRAGLPFKSSEWFMALCRLNLPAKTTEHLPQTTEEKAEVIA